MLPLTETLTAGLTAQIHTCLSIFVKLMLKHKKEQRFYQLIYPYFVYLPLIFLFFLLTLASYSPLRQAFHSASLRLKQNLFNNN